MNAAPQLRHLEQRHDNRPIAISAATHLLVLLILILGLPDFSQPVEAPPPAIIIELADVSDVTTVLKQPDKPPSPPPLPRPADPKPSEPKPPEPVLTPPEPPTPPDVTDVIPPPRPPDAQPAMPTPEPPPVVQPPPPKPRTQPTPPKPRPQPDRSISDLLNNLKEDDSQPTPQPDAPAPSPNSTEAVASGQISDRLTMSEADLLRQKISGCWSLDPGRLGAGQLMIDLQITVAPDKSLLTVEITDKANYYSNSYYRAATDEAIKAIQCAQPFPLPDGAYDRWKNLRLRFDPRSLIL